MIKTDLFFKFFFEWGWGLLLRFSNSINPLKQKRGKFKYIFLIGEHHQIGTYKLL